MPGDREFQSSVDGAYDDEQSSVNGLADDESFQSLDHAPATSHGTYLAGPQEDVESLEDYQEGGYHPIHLGDRLGPAGRYRVIHKLGFGGFSTVWFCHDSQESKYVAIKVHTADVPADKVLDLRLLDLDLAIPGAEYVNVPRDHFSLEGPNGIHQCVVSTPLGPRVSPNLWATLDNPGPVLRKMCLQTTYGLKFLHQNGLCHGDFRPANILVRLANLDCLSEDQILSLIGPPQQSRVATVSGNAPPPSAPEYLVMSADLARLGAKFLTDKVCIIDFGESFRTSSPPSDLGIPEGYLPPEVIIEGGKSIGPACDLWALGCTLFEIRYQMPLFYMLHDTDDVLTDMVKFFGKLPKPWWDKWEAREMFFDEDGTPKDDDEEEPFTLDVCLSNKSELWELGSSNKKVMVVPEAEQKLVKDLLLKIFKYEPSKRLRAEDVVHHDWFKM